MTLADQLPDVLTIRQAAALLGVHPETLRRWDAQGKLRSRRVGPRGTRRYARQDILRLAQSRSDTDRIREAQRLLVDVARTISSSLDLHAVAQTVVDAAARIVGCDRCAIYFLDATRTVLEPLIGVDVHDPGTVETLFYPNPIPVEAIPLARYALERADPIIIADTETHPLSNPEVFRIFNTRSLISISLCGPDGEVFGLMPFTWTAQPHSITQDELFLAQSLAALAGVALSNARLFTQVEQERLRATVVSDVVRGVNSSHNLSDTLNRVLSSLVVQLQADEGSLWLANAAGTVVGAAETRLYGPSRVGATMSIRNSPNIARALELQEPLLVLFEERMGDEARWFETLEVQASLFVPLLAQGHLVGIAFINYLDAPPALRSSDIRFTGVLAAQCALAIERAQLLEAASARAAELEAVISQMGEGIVIADRNGQLVLVNQYAEALYGTARVRLSSGITATYRLLDLEGRSLAEERLPLSRAIMCGETLSNQEWQIVRADGTRVVVNGSATPIVGPQGERLGAVLVLRDVTLRRQIDAEKDQFLSIVSHELKTPLTTIKGLNDLARRRLSRGAPTAEVVQKLDVIAQQVRRMEGLIGDLLDIRRLETGVLPLLLAPLDLTMLVREAGERAQAMTERHTIVVVAEPPSGIIVRADHDRLDQVLDNMLSNAIKYSPNGGSITLDLRCGKGYALLRISDQGIGIPAAGREHLFERFYRGANVRASEYGGLGIGLALSRDLITKHNGTLTLEATSAQGSTFLITLPLDTRADHGSGATGEPVQASMHP
jgi:two-component system, OmpR family, phosphate regulon sensor histidine kinase PhoR